MALSPSPQTVKILDRIKVAPPPGSVPTTSLPLTFFDLLWHLCCPMERLYFYQFPLLTPHYFFETLLPALKHSLSLTLQHFFPFAGSLVCPPSPAKPHILFSDGDSVPLTVAESAGDFQSLTVNHPQDVRELHRLVAELPPARVEEGGARVVPLMALQVTAFPNFGFSVGVTFCHVAADGRAFHHFMKSWASVCYKAKGSSSSSSGSSDQGRMFLDQESPFHGRDSIKIPTGLEQGLLMDFWSWASTTKEYVGPSNYQLITGKVRATFVLSHDQIKRLKSWVTNRLGDNGLELVHISTFVVTCALSWVCLVRSEEMEDGNINISESDKLDDDHNPYFFVFAADCRDRLQNPVPKTYFGNCLAFCMVSVTRKELLGANGIAAAAKAIGKKVKALERGVLEGAEKWMQDWKNVLEKYRFATVAGSPKLGIYETDFGWGRPKKSEVVHTDVSGKNALTLIKSYKLNNTMQRSRNCAVITLNHLYEQLMHSGNGAILRPENGKVPRHARNEHVSSST
ncbi:hypothetical protein TIFTF001_041891 [Ficus carica]|uniref:Uncharacterized protein n=1 Tax=Ficus carica TaxID=3494 RepID=A0AA88CX94_FICCA|nr:hypothetical protein TIFTF001_041891 [Ficus carica]